MAYDKEEIYETAKKAIEENNLFFIEDVVAFLPCAKQTFYDFYPLESDEMDNIKDLLDRNKVKTKSSIRAKLYKGTKASELLALYRLICTPDERRSLNQSYIDHTTKGKKMNSGNVDLSKLDTETLLALEKASNENTEG